MDRRRFLQVGIASGLALAGVHAVRAQQAAMKRVAFINVVVERDPVIPPFVAAMKAGLASEGWVEGRNVQIDIRYGADTPDKGTSAARELLALNPDVVVAVGAAAGATSRLTATTPIIAGPINDAGMLAAGVTNYARPTTNVTGFTVSDRGLIGLEMQMLKELAPWVTKAMGMVDPTSPASAGEVADFEAAANRIGLQPIIEPVANPQDIDRVVAQYASDRSVGILAPSPGGSLLANNHAVVSAAVIRHRIPAVFGNFVYGTEGAVNYLTDNFDIIRRSGSYAGLILKGAKVADLPVQAPTKYSLAVNLKVAQQVGITIPPGVLQRADQLVQ